MRWFRQNWLAWGHGSKALSIGMLYFLLSAGGLWHVLGFFQSLMKILAAPLIITLALLVFWQCARILPGQRDPSTTVSQGRHWFSARARRFYFWGIGVVVITFFAEWLGVQTGWIFGSYRYENTLKPLVLGVPIAIGFAWLAMLLTTTAVVQRLNFIRQRPIMIQALAVASLMVVFDAVMEPAAVYLKYWTWTGDVIPMQNFLAWFLLSLGLSFGGYRWGIFAGKFPDFAFHAFFAQLIYFGIITIHYLSQ